MKGHLMISQLYLLLDFRNRFNYFVAFFTLLVGAAVFTARNGGWSSTAMEVADVEDIGPSMQECDVYDGGWVFDEAARPLYSGLNCSYINDEIACDRWGRKDTRYQQWRWQPRACQLPRFNATRLLEKLKGKRMVFVGDSLNRNQWVSMVCLLDSQLTQKTQKIKYSGSLLSYNAEEYNVTVDFYWSPLLVESNCDDPVDHRINERVFRGGAGAIEKHAAQWGGADIIVFDSYLWWKKPGIKAKVMYGSFENPNEDGDDIELVDGFKLALKAWSEWLELNLGAQKQVFFMSYSPTHIRGEEWGASMGQSCYNETEMMKDVMHQYRSRGKDLWMTAIAADAVGRLRRAGINVRLVNITSLSEPRKEGHPSVFRRFWVNLTEEDLANPNSYSDCTHWCLPGVPDVWNEILYYHLIKNE